MDKQDYIDTLKNLNMRPKKVKIERHEIVLNEQENKMDSVHNKIIKWFMENPYPKDSAIAKLAKEWNMEEPELEEHIYMILSQILSEGKSKDYKGSYDPEQIKMGVAVEVEHTPNKLVAEKIAKDHLVEIKDYYTHLKKMEKSAGVIEEIFIQSAEIEALPAGNERDMQILRLSMIAELDASNLYEKLALLAKSKDVKKVLLDVSKEEKVHAGEFETLLEQIDPEYEKAEKEGEKEVKDMTK